MSRKMANLYEINESLTALIDEETGEILDFEAFEALSLERETKLENIALWIKNLNADAAMYKAEKQAFEEKQKRAERKAESLKTYLSTFLNGEKFKTARVDCFFKKSESVNVIDMSRLPSEFLKYSEPTADKTAIKAAIKEGKEVAGAEILVKNNLQIK